MLISNGCLEFGDAEVLAAMEATQLCHEFGYARVMFVGDAKSIMDVVNLDEQDWSRKGHITNGIRANVQTFEHWTFYSYQQGGKSSCTRAS